MRPTIIAGNWKMNLDLRSVREISEGLRSKLSLPPGWEAWVFPSHLHIPIVAEILAGSPVQVGIQNVYPAPLSAMTGETSPLQAEDFGIRLALVGHSERREFLKETNAVCRDKIHFLLKRGWRVCYCVGETLEEREAGQTYSVLSLQIREGLSSIPSEILSGLAIAYEPVWAIGTGKTATPQTAEEAHSFLRKEIEELYGATFSRSIPILYGGSVKPENLSDLLAEKDIDGGLVGGVSQKLDSFLGLFAKF